MTIRNTPRKPKPTKAKNVVVQVETNYSPGGVINKAGNQSVAYSVVAYGYETPEGVVPYKPGDTINTDEPLFAMFTNESGIALPWERIVTEAEARRMGSRYFDEKQVVPTKIIST